MRDSHNRPMRVDRDEYPRAAARGKNVSDSNNALDRPGAGMLFEMKALDHRISIAPMMDWTDDH